MQMNIYEGSLSARGLRVALVVSRFNNFITDKLLEGALDVLKRSACEEKDISIFKVPGSLEISPLANKLLTSSKFDAIVCLGTIIRGGTPHFTYVANETAKGISKLAIKAGIPVTFGILTTDSIEEAIERSGTKMGNKGADAALVAIEMANLYKNIDKKQEGGLGFKNPVQ